jgi:hypothetical protein
MKARIVGPLSMVLLAVLSASGSPPPIRVGVEQLFENPAKFAGKRVDVTGFYRSGTEDSCLLACAHCADHEMRTEKSIWVDYGTKPLFQRRTVRIIGTFRYEPHPILDGVPYERRFRGFGCYKMWAREITDVTYFHGAR